MQDAAPRRFALGFTFSYISWKGTNAQAVGLDRVDLLMRVDTFKPKRADVVDLDTNSPQPAVVPQARSETDGVHEMRSAAWSGENRACVG